MVTLLKTKKQNKNKTKQKEQNQKHTEKQKTIWFPKHTILKMKNKLKCLQFI